MTLTSKTMEWLNHNRHRSYPMERDQWREKASASSGLDCVLLDALLFDADASGTEVLTVESVVVGEDNTVVTMKYDIHSFSIVLSGGSLDGDGSFDRKVGVVKGIGLRGASVSFVFSSHAFIKNSVGTGTFVLGCLVLPSRVVRLSDGMGIDGISVNGSSRVSGHDSCDVASGDVVLEDGYRTSPIIYDGKVFVRVGRRYGYDPCRYDFGDAGSRDCRRPLFFFCGQNAINNGNIVLKGGKGVSVSQGRSYTVRDANSKCDGMTIPCVEIVAGRELLDICKPPAETEE